MNQLLSPPVVLERIRLSGRALHIVREDVLPGGSKQRACGEMLKSYLRQGLSEFVYASPFAGFAQVALAYVGQLLEVPITIYCERDRSPVPEPDGKHSFAKLAEKYGAKVVLVETLEAGTQLCLQSETETRKNIPLGFNCAEFKKPYEHQLYIQWNQIRKKLNNQCQTLWLPVGSGTLVGAFQSILNRSVEIKAVNVGVLPDEDPRIQKVKDSLGAHFYRAPELFAETAKFLPRTPSNVHYDAKLWRFLLTQAQENDVWWNVAR